MTIDLKTFQSPEFAGEISSLPGCQILNDRSSDVAGLFVKEEAMKLSGFSEAPNFEHTFQSGAKEKGWRSNSPRMHVISQSSRFVQRRDTKEIIANYESRNGQELYRELGENGALRTFYLIYLVNEKNELLHQVPLVLSIYGVAAVRFGKAWQRFKMQMEVNYNLAMNESYKPLNERFHVLTIFQPTFVPSLEPPDAPKKSWVAIPDAVALPDLSAIDRKSPAKFTEAAQKEVAKYICLDRHEQLWKLADTSKNFANIRLPQAFEEPDFNVSADAAETTPAGILEPQTLEANVESIPY